MTMWLDARFAIIRPVLILTCTVLALVGLIAICLGNWHLATSLWITGFLGKNLECWLLERQLVQVQIALEERWPRFCRNTSGRAGGSS